MSPPPFDLWSAPHLVALALTVLVPILLIRAVRRSPSPRTERAICIGLATLLFANQSAGWIHSYLLHGRETFILEHLPLHLCGISVLLSVVVLLARHRLSYELVYFWGLAGAANSVVTPEAMEPWPAWPFVRYFISHSGIVVTALFATWGLGMRPTLRSLLRAFVGLNVLAVALGAVNLALGSNYMYLSEMPDSPSPFLLFPWPWYILWLELVALGFFLLCYLPVWLENRRSGRDAPRNAAG